MVRFASVAVTGQEQTRTTVSRLENGAEMEVQVSRFPFRGSLARRPPLQHPPRPPRSIGSCHAPQFCRYANPYLGRFATDGPALSGAGVGKSGLDGHRVEKEFLIPCPLVFDINTTPNPPSTSTSSASRGIRGLSVHRRHHPRGLHCAASFHRSRQPSRFDGDRTCLDVDWSRHDLAPTSSSDRFVPVDWPRSPPIAHRLPNLRLPRGLYSSLFAVGVKKGDGPSASCPASVVCVCILGASIEPNRPNRTTETCVPAREIVTEKGW